MNDNGFLFIYSLKVERELMMKFVVKKDYKRSF